MKIYTIGFTGKGAERFFTLLQKSGVTTVIDVRLNNSSQLAGFAKKNDLAYFLKAICGINYKHSPNLAPTEEILKGYKKGVITWREYEDRFNQLLAARHIERYFTPETLSDVCFLCSEDTPEQCHRRLVAEYLRDHVDETIEIRHLV